MLKILQVFACLVIALVAGGGMKRGNFDAGIIATDNFNRANGGLGGNWVSSPSFPGLAISSNTVVASGSVWEMAYWNPTTNTFANNQTSQIQLVSGASPGVVVRHQPGVSSGYLALVSQVGTTGTVSIYRFAAGAFTLLLTGSSLSINIGDVLALSVTGTTLVATLNGVTQVTTTDATYSSGSPGIAGFNGALDNWSGSPISALSGGDFAFSLPIGSTLKFMAPGGSDTADGLAPTVGGGHGPWASPNHAMNCGEVILAGPGAYSNVTNDMGTWGTVSNCPSTTGGIDGTGGIYAATLLCAASDITGCTVNCNAGSTPCNSPNSIPAAINIAANNWSIQGWSVTAGSTARAKVGTLGIQAMGCATTTHDIFIINNFIFNVGQGIATSDVCGPGNAGTDYNAWVGNIVQNGNQADADSDGGYCIAAIDVISPGKFDSGTGTHFFIYTNYTYNNITVPSCPLHFDGESFMYDTLQNHSVTGKFVTANNIAFYATRNCINFTWSTPATPRVRFYSNTCYDHNQAPNGGNNGPPAASEDHDGEIHVTACNATSTIDIFNNIAYSPNATGGVGTPLYAAASNPPCTLNIGAVYATGAENIYKGSRSSCAGTGTCNATFDVIQSGGSSLGTNTYLNPSFQNATDLISNQLGVPNCTGFINTTQCMGWNAATSTLTTPSIVSDLIGTAVGSAPYYSMVAGKGFQLPSTTCVSSGEMFNDYPPHLKGLVYLQASGFTAGATITEKAGLVTKPCGM